eukprot:6667196-Prymnesium_polylepis.1
MAFNSDAVLRTVYYKYPHPKEVSAHARRTPSWRVGPATTRHSAAADPLAAPLPQHCPVTAF